MHIGYDPVDTISILLKFFIAKFMSIILVISIASASLFFISAKKMMLDLKLTQDALA